MVSESVVSADILAGIPNVVTVLDEDGEIRYANPAVEDVLGYDPEALVGERAFEYVHPEDRESVREAFEAFVAASGDHRSVRFRCRGAKGSWVPLEARTGTRTCPEIEGYVVTCRERRDQRAAERERQAIFDRMGDGFFAVDDDWRVTFVNQAGRELLADAMGRDPETADFEGLHLWEEIPEAVDTVFHEKYTEAMSRQQPVEFESYFDPLSAWFDVRAFPSESGLSVYFRDVTEERRSREALRRRERVLREVHDVIADRGRSFVEQVEALLAIGREELGVDYGSLSRIEGEQYVFEVVDAADDLIEVDEIIPLSVTNCERVASDRETLVLGDIARQVPDETVRAGYAELGIACYLGAPVFTGETVQGTLCFYGTEPRAKGFSDWEVTLVDLLSQWISYERERKQTTERLARQNETLERFASIVSHDLRNPLTVLGGSLDAVEGGEDRDAMARCRRAVERMEVLVDDLLALARAGATVDDLEQVALPTLVRSAWEGVATADATVEVGAKRRFLGDPTRVRQLLANLLANSVEHGGEDVRIRVGDLPDGFYLEDDGPGIDPDVRDRVFDSGYSTRTGGTGLGLSIVNEVASAHGWEVSVSGSEAGGARFEITGVERPAER